MLSWCFKYLNCLLEVAKRKCRVLNNILFSIKEACAAVKVFQSKESSVEFLTYQKSNYKNVCKSQHILSLRTSLGGAVLTQSPQICSVMNLPCLEINIEGEKTKRSEWPHVNVKVEPRSTFTLTHDLSYISSILFAQVNFSRALKHVF